MPVSVWLLTRMLETNGFYDTQGSFFGDQVGFVKGQSYYWPQSVFICGRTEAGVDARVKVKLPYLIRRFLRDRLLLLRTIGVAIVSFVALCRSVFLFVIAV